MDIKVVNENLNNFLQTHKIAIWPIIDGIAKWIGRLSILTDDAIYLVDSSPVKQGMVLHGKTVHAPDIIVKKDIRMVLITTGSTVGTEIKNQIQKDFPNVKIVKPIGMLFFSKLLDV